MIRDCLVVDLADVTLSKRLQMDTNLKLQRAIESARNSELVKRQQGTIRNTVKSYEIKVVRRKTSRSSKYKDCPWCGDYRACKRSRCPANYSRCFKCGKPGHFKTACRTRAVKSIEKAPNIFSIATGNITSNSLIQKIRNKLVSDHPINCF